MSPCIFCKLSPSPYLCICGVSGAVPAHSILAGIAGDKATEGDGHSGGGAGKRGHRESLEGGTCPFPMETPWPHQPLQGLPKDMIHGHSLHLQGQVGVHGCPLAHRDAVAEIPSPGNTERALDVIRLWEGQDRTQNPWQAFQYSKDEPTTKHNP